MSVSYSAVIFLGKEFDSGYEAKEFYKKHMHLSEEKADILDDAGLEDFLWEGDSSGLETMTRYSGDGFVLGFNLRAQGWKSETFLENIAKLSDTWKKHFNEEPEIILAVRIS